MVPRMTELAALLAQLTGQNQQAASDPALAAAKLTRATLDALVLKLGHSIEARVVGQLAGGLTQFAAGGESFVLKLETPLPPGTSVTLKVTPNPQGTPTVTVSVPAATPQPAQPLPLPIPTAPLVAAPASQPPPTSPAATASQPVQPQLAQPAPPPRAASPQPPPQLAQPPSPAPAPPAQPAVAPPSPQPQVHVATTPAIPPRQPVSPQPAAVAPTAQLVAAAATPAAPPTTPLVQPQVQAMPPVAQPAAQVSLPVTPMLPATPPAVVAAAPPAAAVPLAQPAPVLAPPPVVQAPQPLPVQPSPYPVHAAATPVVPAAQQPSLPQTPAPAPAPAPVLSLADPAQAAARQDSVAPLLAKLATIVTAAAPTLPRPVIEVAQKLLANRVDLNRGAPDAKALEAAVLKSGVPLTPPSREAPADSRSALLALRSALIAFAGSDAAPIDPVERPAPPLKGEPPRSPPPQAPLPDPSADARDTARTLLGHTDAALSRLKLLQVASQPAEVRIDAPVPRTELRVEIPVLLGAETGILQLLVERDGKHKRAPQRERGWRMRFAVNLSATGEVGAEIALMGRAANVAIWAADPDTADALEDLLPELAPAIQRHGLELASLRVRRGAPQPARTAPGQLLDSAR